MSIWTLTVPARPIMPAAPAHDPLPEIVPAPTPVALSYDDPGYAAALVAHRVAIAAHEQSVVVYDAAVAVRATADAAHQTAISAWRAEMEITDAIDRQPVKTVYGITEIGGGQFRADVDIAVSGAVERCAYVYTTGGADASAAHTQLVALHAAGTFAGHISPPPAPDLIAYVAARRWRKEVGGCVVDGHQVATDRDSQSKLLAEFVAIGGGVRTDPSPWKFADGEFATLTNAQMAVVCMGARAHVAGAFSIEGQVLAGIAAGTITTTAQIDSAFS